MTYPQFIGFIGLTLFLSLAAGCQTFSTTEGNNLELETSPFLRKAWEALDGTAIWAGPTLGPEDNLYVSSGQGEGQSNLRAFDSDGKLLWEAAPQKSLADLDYGAVLNAPVVDAEGKLYQADSNQLWSFDANGSIRWVANLEDHEISGQLLTPILTREGHIAGVSTDGKFIAFDRNTGQPIWPALALTNLPISGLLGTEIPRGFSEGLVSPAYRQAMWNILTLNGVNVSSPPAIDPKTGRIFVTGIDASSAMLLYAIDTEKEGAQIAFKTNLGIYAVGPSLSPDGHRAYLANVKGGILAVDTESGDILWNHSDIATAQVPGVGPDDTLYLTTRHELVALEGATGNILWQRDYHELAEKQIPQEAKGKRTASMDTVLTVSDGPKGQILWASLNLNITIPLRPGPGAILTPQQSILAAIDSRDGSILSTTPLRDTSSFSIVPGRAGKLYVALTGNTSSYIHYGASRSIPEEYRLQGAPKAGLMVFEAAD